MKSRKSKSKKKSLVVSWGIVILIVVLVLVFASRSGSSKAVEISDHDPVIGRDNAPITIMMFGIHSCTYSAEFFKEIYPWLKEEYIDTGKAKFVYKNFYASLKKATAGEAVLCAHDQGMFLPYNSVLFERSGEWGKNLGEMSIEEIINSTFAQYANELGLDEKIFLECLSQHRYRDHVVKDYGYAAELGVSKPPTFFINDLMIEGLPLLEDFKSVLLKFKHN